MPSSRATALSAELTVHAALDALDQHKERLCAVIESQQSTPEEKYEALVVLAHLTGILTNATDVLLGMEKQEVRSSAQGSC